MQILVTSDSVAGAAEVRQLLESQGHEVAEPTSRGAGALLADAATDLEAGIAVFWQKSPSRQRRNAMLVEVGVMLGRNVPLLIVSRPDFVLPYLAGVPRVDGSPGSDWEHDSLLQTQIRLFLRGVQSNSPRKLPRASRQSSTRIASHHLRGEVFELDVLALLRESGLDVIAEREQQATDVERSDFTIPLYDGESGMGVVLIETKDFPPQATRGGAYGTWLRGSPRKFKGQMPA